MVRGVSSENVLDGLGFEGGAPLLRHFLSDVLLTLDVVRHLLRVGPALALADASTLWPAWPASIPCVCGHVCLGHACVWACVCVPVGAGVLRQRGQAQKLLLPPHACADSAPELGRHDGRTLP